MEDIEVAFRLAQCMDQEQLRGCLWSTVSEEHCRRLDELSAGGWHPEYEHISAPSFVKLRREGLNAARKRFL